MTRRRALATWAVATSLLAACGGAKSDARATPGDEALCRVRLEPPTPAASPAPAPPSPSSRIVANVTLPLAALAAELEAKVPRRLVEERDRDIGIAGRLQTTADRGPISVSVAGESLVVRTPIRARAEACAKGRCYASCEPEALATVTVPLRLTPGFTFQPSRAEIAMTRGCNVRALGGFVRIDVTPMVESAARGQLRRVEQEVDARLPKLRPQAERFWRVLGEPISLGLACVDTNATQLVQGPSSGTATTLDLRFALVAAPEVRDTCAASPKRPLPPLGYDAAMPTAGDVDLAFVAPLAGPALVRGVDCGPGEAKAIGRGPAWADGGRSFAFGEIEVTPPGSPDLGPRLARELRVTPRVDPTSLRETLPELAKTFQDPAVDVAVEVASVTPTTAAVRGPDVVGVARARGAVRLRFKAVP